MKSLSTPLAAGLLALAVSAPPVQAATDCRSFALERSGATLQVRGILVASGRSEVFLPARSGDGTIALIVASQPGLSGDFIRGSQASPLIARCEDGRLQILVQGPDGPPREVLARTMAELGRLRYTVGVVSWDGLSARFGIDGWRSAGPEPGPVVDLFSGKIPLGPGDYSITIEVKEVADGRSSAPQRVVEVPVERLAGYLLLPGRLGSVTGFWVLDTAAGTTLIDPDLVPAGTEVRPLSLEETSTAGRRTIPFALGGAGGSVDAVFGAVNLSVAVGSLSLGDLDLIAGPPIPPKLRLRTGKPLLGILGLDVLRSFGSITLSFPTIESVAGRASIGGPADRAEPADLSLPLSETKSALAAIGHVGAIQLSLILDTGSPRTFLSTRAATTANLTSHSTALEPTGLDGNPLAVREATAQLRLAGRSLEPLAMVIADLPVLEPLDHGDQRAGLIGTDLLARYCTWRIDFLEPRIDLWR